MRKNIVAGNWKMNTLLNDGKSLASEVGKLVADKGVTNVDVVVAPPFTAITEIVKSVEGTAVAVSSQNCSSDEKGAYTGEVSAEMVKSTGAKYVILGHSERRQYQKENADLLGKKTKQVLANGLTPIFCIGELLEEREAGNHFDIVKSQIADSLFDLSAEDFGKIVLAYEPVWAIGTGVTASSDQAQEIHAYIRGLLVDKYGDAVAQDTSILYGGSCKPSNAQELFSCADIDGGLIGGAALNAEDFLGIITAF